MSDLEHQVIELISKETKGMDKEESREEIELIAESLQVMADDL